MDSGAVACAGIHRRIALYKLMKSGFAVCISGHRPERLPTGPPLRMLQSLLYNEIKAAAEDGADIFYTGMARGTDLWAADMILHFRHFYPAIRLFCVVPCRSRLQNLSGAERYHVQAVMKEAYSVKVLSENFHRNCFRDRNEYMVSHSQRLIALMTDIRSGTGQTIHMAQRAGLDLRVISPEAASKIEFSAQDVFF